MAVTVGQQAVEQVAGITIAYQRTSIEINDAADFTQYAGKSSAHRALSLQRHEHSGNLLSQGLHNGTRNIAIQSESQVGYKRRRRPQPSLVLGGNGLENHLS